MSLTLDSFVEHEVEFDILSWIKSLPCNGMFIGEENIAGMDCIVTANTMLIMLRKGWLHQVWRKFNWKVKKGVGINNAILVLAAKAWNKLVVVVDSRKKEVYVGDPNFLLQECSKWVVKTTKDGTPIVAIPVSYLYRYKGEKIIELRKKLNSL